MPRYIEKALHRFCVPVSPYPQHSYHQWLASEYGKKVQMNKPPDLPPNLSSDGKRYIQEVVGVILYHARALNSPALVALSCIGTEQATPTEFTEKAVAQLLNYCATYSNSVFLFCASDMVLRVYSDASYLSVTKGRSRVTGYFYLSSVMPSDNCDTPVKQSSNLKLAPNTEPPPPWNSAVYVMCSIIADVMSSTTEAKIAAEFKSCQACVSIRTALIEMGHP